MTLTKSSFFFIMLAILNSFFSSSTLGAPLEIGADAPDLQITTEEGKTKPLADFYKSDFTLIYFYPKADTPGCTKQSCNLRDAFAVLKEKGITVLGVSNDKPQAQKAFKEKYQLPFTLIADSDLKVIQAFGVPTAKKGFARRQTFLIQNKKIVWRDLKAIPAKQAQEALKAIEKLKSKTDAD